MTTRGMQASIPGGPPPWLRAVAGGVVLDLHIAPRAARSAVQGRHGAALKIRLRAPPVDGRANAELLAFLARELGLAPGRVILLAGASGHRKRVLVCGLDPDAIHARLEPG